MSTSEITNSNIVWIPPTSETTSGSGLAGIIGSTNTGGAVGGSGVFGVGGTIIGGYDPYSYWTPGHYTLTYASPYPSFRVVEINPEDTVLQIDIPGAKQNEIDLKVLHGNLNLTTNGKRRYSSTHFLGFTFSKVYAHLEDGVLTLSFQKTGTQNISIEVNKS